MILNIPDNNGASLTGNEADIDCFLDAAGAGSILELSMSMGKIGSRFVFVVLNNVLRSFDLRYLTFSLKSITGSG